MIIINMCAPARNPVGRCEISSERGPAGDAELHRGDAQNGGVCDCVQVLILQERVDALRGARLDRTQHAAPRQPDI